MNSLVSLSSMIIIITFSPFFYKCDTYNANYAVVPNDEIKLGNCRNMYVIV